MAKNINLGLRATAVAGTPDAIEASFTPAVTDLAEVRIKIFEATGANTITNPTLKADATAAKVITKFGGQPLVIGDIKGFAIVAFDQANDRWELLNPASGAGDSSWEENSGIVSLKQPNNEVKIGVTEVGLGKVEVHAPVDAAALLLGDAASGFMFFQHTANGFQLESVYAFFTLIPDLILFTQAGNGTRLLQHDDDGIVSGVTALPAGVTGTKSQVGLGNVDNTSDVNKPVSTAQQTALDTKTDKLLTANRQTASYTLALSDADKLVEMNVGSANDLIVPTNASVAFPAGTQILLAQYGAGQTTVVASGGVTIRSSGGKLKLAAQYAGATLVKIATNEWYLFGDITT